MGNMTPTRLERQFLRAIAAINPVGRLGEEDWWSAADLQHTPLFPDFRGSSVLSIAALGRSAVAKGLAVTRQAGTRGHRGPRSHGWAEYRVSSYGLGLMSDSCIGGGALWPENATRCPACGTPKTDLVADPLAPRIPAHPLPGYLPTPVLPVLSVIWADADRSR